MVVLLFVLIRLFTWSEADIHGSEDLNGYHQAL